MGKDTKKKVEKVVNCILKELRMTRKKYDEVKGAASKMKAIGKLEILTPTTIVVT